MDYPALQWKVLGSADRRIVSLVLALQSASEDLGCVQPHQAPVHEKNHGKYRIRPREESPASMK